MLGYGRGATTTELCEYLGLNANNMVEVGLVTGKTGPPDRRQINCPVSIPQHSASLQQYHHSMMSIRRGWLLMVIEMAQDGLIIHKVITIGAHHDDCTESEEGKPKGRHSFVFSNQSESTPRPDWAHATEIMFREILLVLKYQSKLGCYSPSLTLRRMQNDGPNPP
jgi:hypothetical protein